MKINHTWQLDYNKNNDIATMTVQGNTTKLEEAIIQCSVLIEFCKKNNTHNMLFDLSEVDMQLDDNQVFKIHLVAN